MCEEWTKAGHDVVLYNDPMEFNARPFEQRNVANFVAQDDRDVLIIFRSPNTRVHTAKGLKVWWSCDQYTVDDFNSFSKKVDRIVCISNHHVEYFANVYDIHTAIYIDLPVRLDDFQHSQMGKQANKLLFTSIPDRGLKNLFRIFPKIKREMSNVSLTITSDGRRRDAGKRDTCADGVVGRADVWNLPLLSQARITQRDCHLIARDRLNLQCVSGAHSTAGLAVFQGS